jgi:hypothetical protein
VHCLPQGSAAATILGRERALAKIIQESFRAFQHFAKDLMPLAEDSSVINTTPVQT